MQIIGSVSGAKVVSEEVFQKILEEQPWLKDDVVDIAASDAIIEVEAKVVEQITQA